MAAYRLSLFLGALFVITLLLGCSRDNASTVTPLGDRAALERLAEAYDSVSNQRLTTSPMSLPGPERKRFIERVFSASGYDYAETLHYMATSSFDASNPLHKDLAELALLPHQPPKYPVDPADIYSAKELQDVAILERLLKH